MKGAWKPGAAKPAPQVLSIEDLNDVTSFAIHASVQKQRHQLPVYKQRENLLYLVENHGTTIVVGETGSGKTTQIPQLLAEAGWAEGGRAIACTQPRQIAAQTIAARVAEEMRVTLGTQVGYSVRFDEVATRGVTKIKYMTDGVLLREMMADPLLSSYSVIMVDEAHERSIATDILLGLLKKIIRRRPDLRLIVASATMDTKAFRDFFDTSGEKLQSSRGSIPNRSPAILLVEGRTHPVLVHYSDEPVQDYLRSAVLTTMSIHKNEAPGDILVFLTGQDDVNAAVQMISDEAERLPRALVALPLYAGLPAADQELVFRPSLSSRRKVILATNIAETSVTLPGIVYVIDSGFSKQKFYNPVTNVEALVAAPVSQASAEQRAGRAGRERPGKCFRLYTEETFASMRPEAVPEIQKANLLSTILQLKALGIDNVMQFDWLAPPPAEFMVRALEILYALGVMDASARLTSPLGYQVSELPLDPMSAKMLITGAEIGCQKESLTIAAVLSVQTIWASGRERKEMDEARAQFAVAEGDMVSYLNVYDGYLQAKNRGQWCHENCVNYHALVKVAKVRSQLNRLLQQLNGGGHQQHDGDVKLVTKAVTSGFFSNAARLETEGGNKYRSLRGNQELLIHPASVLFRATPKWVVFQSIIFLERYYMWNVTAVDPAWLSELAPHFYQLGGVRV